LKDFKDGESITTEGEFARKFYIILEGEVLPERKREAGDEWTREREEIEKQNDSPQNKELQAKLAQKKKQRTEQESRAVARYFDSYPGVANKTGKYVEVLPQDAETTEQKQMREIREAKEGITNKDVVGVVPIANISSAISLFDIGRNTHQHAAREVAYQPQDLRTDIPFRNEEEDQWEHTNLDKVRVRVRVRARASYSPD